MARSPLNRCALALVSLLAACADRVAPSSDGPPDATAAQPVHHCVQPEPLPYVGYCDELRDFSDCNQWGIRYAAGAQSFMLCNHSLNIGNPDAYVHAQCVSASDCVVVDGDGGQRWSCHCGNEPGCGDGSVCVSDAPDATPYCRCAIE